MSKHVHKFEIPPPQKDTEYISGVCDCGEIRQFQQWDHGSMNGHLEGKLRNVSCANCSEFFTTRHKSKMYCDKPICLENRNRRTRTRGQPKPRSFTNLPVSTTPLV